MRLPTGLQFTIPRWSRGGSEVYVTNCNVDWGSEELLAQYLDTSGSFIDIGANIGYYSIYMAPCVKSVYAFEPNSRVLPALRANSLVAKNITVIAKAVAAFDGITGFQQERDSEVSHVIEGGDGERGVCLVPAVTIDSFVRDQKIEVTGIKIDAEGADFAIITGMKETMITQQPLVLSEVGASRELFSFLNSINYECFGFVMGSVSERASFAKIAELGFATKMLFLVPPRLQSEFAKLAAAREVPRGLAKRG